jgi:hypothetical protein
MKSKFIENLKNTTACVTMKEFKNSIILYLHYPSAQAMHVAYDNAVEERKQKTELEDIVIQKFNENILYVNYRKARDIKWMTNLTKDLNNIEK